LVINYLYPFKSIS